MGAVSRKCHVLAMTKTCGSSTSRWSRDTIAEKTAAGIPLGFPGRARLSWEVEYSELSAGFICNPRSAIVRKAGGRHRYHLPLNGAPRIVRECASTYKANCLSSPMSTSHRATTPPWTTYAQTLFDSPPCTAMVPLAVKRSGQLKDWTDMVNTPRLPDILNFQPTIVRLGRRKAMPSQSVQRVGIGDYHRNLR